MISDTELINKWKNGRNYASYSELKRRHTGMVINQVNKYRAASVPYGALQGEGWRLFDEAVNTYKTDKGAQFITHLGFQLRKIDRFVKKYQNVARIPENLSSRIGEFDRTHSSLSVKFGRPPTDKEIASAMKWKLSAVKRLQKGRRNDLFEGGFEQVGGLDVSRGAADTNSILSEVREELTPSEQQVFDMILNFDPARGVIKKNKKAMSRTAIASKLNVSTSRLSQVTSEIAKKIKPHLAKVYGVGVQLD